MNRSRSLSRSMFYDRNRNPNQSIFSECIARHLNTCALSDRSCLRFYDSDRILHCYRLIFYDRNHRRRTRDDYPRMHLKCVARSSLTSLKTDDCARSTAKFVESDQNTAMNGVNSRNNSTGVDWMVRLSNWMVDVNTHSYKKLKIIWKFRIKKLDIEFSLLSIWNLCIICSAELLCPSSIINKERKPMSLKETSYTIMSLN